MGTKMAPSYANIFMGILEKQMLSTYPHKPFIYFRYIDDIFMIWTDGEDSLNTFLEHCNKQNKHIKFKPTGTGTTVPFLDVSVTLKNGKLHSDLYCKPIDKHQYLYYTSCHPKHTKNSLPYSLALRLRRICSTEHLFSLRTDEMKQHLLKRGYTKGCINDAINKASQVPRREAIMEKLEQNKLDRVPFVITYNPLLPNIPKLLQESQTILNASEKCSEVFKNTPLVSYRRGRNLNDMLCSKRIPQQKDTNQRNKYSRDVNNKSEKESQPKTNQCTECGILLKNEKGLKIHRSSKHRRQQNNPTSPGFWPCKSDSRCDTCRRGHFCTSVESSKNGRKHQIQQPLTCKSKNICYLIHCKHCNQQYTGETQLEFHLRLNNHTSDIKLNKKSTGMVRHFGDCGVNNMQPVILEKVRSSDPFIRKAKEQFYIDLLETEINAL